MSDRWSLPLLATGFAIGIVIGRTLASAPPPSPRTAARALTASCGHAAALAKAAPGIPP